ncbi:DNA adenine methylase [Treponema sp. TIM-1]|uniref:DNA adenine methylase n=1 Tax=Treponema sp. TIM-1 TaxID=2898417 RepID=UPI0039817FF5
MTEQINRCAGDPAAGDAPLRENKNYLTRQLITYIGNKRSLLPFIGTALERVKARLNKKRLSLFDVFSGSGAAARFFKAHGELLLVNDLEAYSETINRCYLANVPELDMESLRQTHARLLARLREEPLREGFIAELYAPREDSAIRTGERVFYTSRNARYLDTARQYIEELEEPLRPFFLAPLLSEASVHANTAGVFKGFYKDRRTGQGRFGGSGETALHRITGDIKLPFPVFSNFVCPVRIYREDANRLVRETTEVDAAYLDPPYNQHPYGSNYFMLNLILNYRRPSRISPVSGIPPEWNRSVYNRKQAAPRALADLAEHIRAKFLLISFNSDGFISREEMEAILHRIGRVEILETPYNTFRGSRNLQKRDIHVKEYLYIVEK